MALTQKRKHTRLEFYDYASAGAFFITLPSYLRKPIFGRIIDHQVQLSVYGQIVRDEWLKTSQIRSDIDLDEFIVMPDHFHAIVFFVECFDVGAHSCAPLQKGENPKLPFRLPRSLGSLVAGFKSSVTAKINTPSNLPGRKIWQRNYYDHVIRNEEDLERIREYILENPFKLGEDNSLDIG
ncbi:MAG: transposase [Anaerolineaceae bacterium]